MAAAFDEPYLLVAAIDFGATYSGYAFSFRATEDDDSLPEQILMITNSGEELGFQVTIVLARLTYTVRKFYLALNSDDCCH